MPKGKGLYKRKGAQGRIMYFRDGALSGDLTPGVQQPGEKQW